MKRERLKYVSIFLIVSVVLVGGWYAVYRLFNRPVEPYIRTVFTAEETAVVFDKVQWPQREAISLKALVYYPTWRDPSMYAYFFLRKEAADEYGKLLQPYESVGLAPEGEAGLSYQDSTYYAIQKKSDFDTGNTFWVYDWGEDVYLVCLYVSSFSEKLVKCATDKP